MKILSKTLILLSLIFFIGCSKTDNTAPKPEKPVEGNITVGKGLGPSKEAPVGKPYSLPTGIELVSEHIPGYDRNTCPCSSTQSCDKGVGSAVWLCLRLKNTTNKPITVTFPAGLIFISISTKTQNGLLIQVETFEVPANEVGQFSLKLMCANVDRDTSKPEDLFTLGPVTEFPELVKLMDMLKNKDLKVEGARSTVQGVTWDVTNGKPIHDYYMAKINAIPNKK